jgi:formamidopyrimidine-DNA glycosylase
MPELPEMQALSERLEDAFGGTSLTRAQPLQFSALKTFAPTVDEVLGRTLERVGRRGKYVILAFGGPRILVHLSQGGRVGIEEPAKTTRPKMGVVRFWFSNSKSFLVKEFGTQRKAAWWILPPDDDGPLERLGPEPFGEAFKDLILTSSDTRRIHTLLRDQRTVAGIGRGYADDILHRARLSPYAQLAKLTEDERLELVDATHAVLEEALVAERKRVGGLPTKIGDHFTVHNRYNSPCPVCNTKLQRVSYESHEVTYCPHCQTEGKVLADRRLSRLVK